jgi:hypothetical protein
MYSSTHSQPQKWEEVNGQLHALATLPLEKENCVGLNANLNILKKRKPLPLL